MKPLAILLLLSLQLIALPAWAKGGIAAAEKTVPGGILAMVSYVVLWFMLLAYFVVLTVRLSKVRSDIKGLEGRIDGLFEDEED